MISHDPTNSKDVGLSYIYNYIYMNISVISVARLSFGVPSPSRRLESPWASSDRTSSPGRPALHPEQRRRPIASFCWKNCHLDSRMNMNIYEWIGIEPENAVQQQQVRWLYKVETYSWLFPSSSYISWFKNIQNTKKHGTLSLWLTVRHGSHSPLK